MNKREEIKAFVGNFVEVLTKMMREAASEAATSALDAAFGDALQPEEASSPAPAATTKSKRPARARKAAPQTAPTSDDMEKQVLAAVRSNPYAGAGAIAAAVGKTPVQIRPTLNALAATGAIKKSGMGRGTTYTTIR